MHGTRSDGRALRRTSPRALLRRIVASASRLPFAPSLARTHERVQGWRRGSMDAENVLHAVRLLEEEGVRFWVAGGWGVDALLGRQTRQHEDLDIVIDDFSRDGPRACVVLESSGYLSTPIRDPGLWMKRRTLLDDGRGHRIELLSINSDNRAARDMMGTPGFSCVGWIGGRQVPCLGVDAQVLFHTGFRKRLRDQHDLSLLVAGG